MRAFYLSSAAIAASAGLAGGAWAAPPAPFDWSGYFIGANIGWVGVHDTATDAANFLVIPTWRLHANGILGGVQVGRNFQRGPFVFGIEGDVDAASASASVNPPLDLPRSVDLRGLATLRAKAGYAFDRTLLYVTGGLAFGDIVNHVNDTGHSLDASGWRTGWVAGGGAQYALSSHWSVKAQVLFVDFGSTGIVGVPSSQYAFRFRDTAVIGQVGIDFRF